VARFLDNLVVKKEPDPKRAGMVKVTVEDSEGRHQEVSMDPSRVNAHVEGGKTTFTVPDLPWLTKSRDSGGRKGAKRQ
jgi:YbbR domain-containing protein